jgi:hypothetical protein
MSSSSTLMTVMQWQCMLLLTLLPRACHEPNMILHGWKWLARVFLWLK